MSGSMRSIGALGAGTTSADIQRYANALDGHYYFRLISIGDETRWCAVAA